MYHLWFLLFSLFIPESQQELAGIPGTAEAPQSIAQSLECNCNISQGGNTYAISALENDISATAFYSYGNPNGSSANTGLEQEDALVIFLYQDTITSVVSFFFIMDVVNDDDGGTAEAEFNCLPNSAFVSLSDDGGELGGAPPLITGDWFWSSCCTDGGIIEDVGCGNSFNLDLLVSTGVDSIVWLTGDLNNPQQILMAMSGEDILIDCGGGICCPVDLDTEIIITDATCPDTPNGSIDINPQDGVPQYSYDWAHGPTSEDVTDLLPGLYMVTITDSQGCTEELQITVDVSPGEPDADPANIMICADSDPASFDLTSVNNIVNQGSGFDVLWFENSDLTGPIGTPGNYVSGSGTVYAAVDNGSCLSAPVPVDLTLVLSPVANPTSLNACEESNGMAIFDLTTISDIVSGGAGSVSWYLDVNLLNPISDPTAFLSVGITIYAIVNDGTCLSEPAAVELIVDPKPVGTPADLHECGDEFNDAVFDLTTLDIIVSGGTGSVEWYEDQELTLHIDNPTQYMSPTTTVYAEIFDGICYSDPIPVQLVVDQTPVGTPVTAEMCDDGTGVAVFNLYDLEQMITGGVGGASWYFDEVLSDPIPDPDNFLTETTVIWAVVDDGVCVSDPVMVELFVVQSPVGNPTFLETCADSTGQGVFDLTLAYNDVSGGTGIVIWFEDPQGNVIIEDSSMFVSGDGTVYAQVDDSVCVSDLVAVNLSIINSVSATTVDFEACDDGNGLALFDLTTIEDAVSSGSGQVNWFLDSLGTMPIGTPGAFLSGDSIVYANVSAGACTSETVPVYLITLSSPESTGAALQLCGDANSEVLFDLTTLDTVITNNDLELVIWYGDILLTQMIPDPMNFLTGDTIVYAVVSNGACESQPATVLLFVAQGLFASSDTLDLCIPDGDTMIVDLTQLDNVIGGGLGQVNWYADSLGNTPISPGAYPVDGTETVWVSLSAGICTSESVPILINVEVQPEPQTHSIKKCGDVSGQVVFNLTNAEGIVSGGVGSVTWYTDPGQTMAIGNPGMFLSGDSTVYAVVTNGICTAAAVPVSLEVVDSLVADPASVLECILDNNSTTVDLTSLDIDVSGGNGTVYWFTDNAGSDTISNPQSYMTGTSTVYASFAADGCISNIVPVILQVEEVSYPEPVCAFSSIDSLSVTWAGVAPQYQISYTINGQTGGAPSTSSMTDFGLGSLGQGDTLELTVTAVFSSGCDPLSTSITCITDVCPPQTVEFIGLDTEYCRDETFIVINTTPQGGVLSGDGISGDTLYPDQVPGQTTELTYVWEDLATGCVYDIKAEVSFIEPPVTPAIQCDLPTLSSVAFSWSAVASEYGYEYSVNQGALSGAILTNDASLMIGDLNEGDEVELYLWSIGTAPCKNSDTVSVSCITEQCPSASLQINDPGILCSDEAALNLTVLITGLPGNPDIIWSGDGVSDASGVFDPSLALPGENEVFVQVQSGGCSYDTSMLIEVQQVPVSAFEISGIPCQDSVFQVTFSGFAPANAQFNWDLSGADIIGGNYPTDFAVSWSSAGSYVLALSVEDNGCISQSFGIPVTITAPLEAPVLYCVEEDFYSITVGWDPVPGVTYSASSDIGNGVVSGSTFIIRQLPDDTTVNITVTASDASPCGTAVSTIQCKTVKFIPEVITIPNLFSPNNDNINDIFFIQANSRITEVLGFRVFNRWGGIVFEQSNFPPNDPAYGWDGTISGNEIDPGVFVYWVNVRTQDGDERIVTGDVTLIR